LARVTLSRAATLQADLEVNRMKPGELDPPSNPTDNPTLPAGPSRRDVLGGGLGALSLLFFSCSEGRPINPPGSDRPPPDGAPDGATGPLLGFAAIAPSDADTVRVPSGYVASVLYAWGDPISDGPAFKQDASQDAEDQAVQAGMHHDGIHFFPLPAGSSGSERGLLAMNHEYTDDGLLHPGGFEPWTAQKVAKSQAAHGVSIIEIERAGGRYRVVRPSRHARRITARTPIRVAGPAAGDALLRTAADPAGTEVLGTLNNCAMGHTPWGTYLSCEENFNGYFAHPASPVPAALLRYGIANKDAGYRWSEHDERFDAERHPNEPNRFGWVVEIDPYDPTSMPVKRTALGRVKHEGATTTLAPDGRVVVYMGDDERFEYIYKFVSKGRFDPADRAGALRLLDEGTLYVARFDAGGAGTWLPLVHGAGGLDEAAGFASQAQVLVWTRQAADKVGATRMDRPEWIAVHPVTREVYCSLTNNSQRGAMGKAPTDEANPRAENLFGHIIRWRERGDDPAATTFRWDLFVLAGDPKQEKDAHRGNVRGDAFCSPDGLWFDGRGVLWIQTDVSSSVLNTGVYQGVGNNQMLAADPKTGEVRRFLTGPRGCEITGITGTPDGRALFVNIQHPGEPATERNDPATPQAVSTWPDGPAGGRPRSATLVIQRADGGLIGT
jgi:hypothetical protein